MAIRDAIFGKRRSPPVSADHPRALPPVIPSAPSTAVNEAVAGAQWLTDPEVSAFWSRGGRNESKERRFSHKKNRVLYFQETVTPASIKHFHHRIIELIELGATEIILVINSPGGLVIPSLHLYELLKFLPVKIRTHGKGTVHSAANILFLTGRERSADANTTFLFHPMTAQVKGRLSSQQFDKHFRQLNQIEEALAQVYRERTKLTDATIERFKHETIIYNAETALQLGIVDRIEDLQMPGGEIS